MTVLAVEDPEAEESVFGIELASNSVLDPAVAAGSATDSIAAARHGSSLTRARSQGWAFVGTPQAEAWTEAKDTSSLNLDR